METTNLMGHRRPLRVCLAGPLFYESDNRTMRYAETLQQRGDEVEVLALRRPGQPREGVVNGVKVFRLQERVRNETSRFSYVYRLMQFLLRSTAFLSRRCLTHRYDFIHVHSIPDLQVFCTVVPRFRGAKVLLDIYDVLPEFYLSKYGAKASSPVYKLLLLQEFLSARFAHHVISANHIWQKKLTSRAVSANKCTPFINYVDTRLFFRHERNRTDNRFVVLYPGVLNWHQGVDIAVRAFQKFSTVVPNAEFQIYGDGPEKPRLVQLIQELDLVGRVFLKEPVPLAEIPQVMANADIGVVGKRADVFGNEAYSTKILEYMSQGLPPVIPRTAIDTYYFDESAVQFFAPGDAEDMAKAMLRVVQVPGLKESMVSKGFAYVQDNSWEQKKQEYLALVDRLVSGR